MFLYFLFMFTAVIGIGKIYISPDKREEQFPPFLFFTPSLGSPTNFFFVIYNYDTLLHRDIQVL